MWKSIKLALRWQVLKAIGKLLAEVGDVMEDNQLSDDERARVWSRLWELIRVYRGER